MKRFSLLGLVLLAVLVAAAASTTSAFAVGVQPHNLPEGVKKFSGEADGTANPIFHSSAGDVECKKAESLESTETSSLPPLGLFHIHFKECKQPETGATCTGTSETSGVILVLGTWHLYFDKKKGVAFEKLTTATLFLVEPVTFKCGLLFTIEVKGETLCLDLLPETTGRDFLFHCAGNSHTEPDDEWCKGGDEVLGAVDMCLEPIVPKLVEKVNGGEALAAVELALGLVLYEVNVTGTV